MESISNVDLPIILNNSIEQSKDTHLESHYNNNEKDSQDLLEQINIKDKNYINKNINITNSTMLDKLSTIKQKESKSTLNIHINANPNSNKLNINDQKKIIERYKKKIIDLESKLSQVEVYHMKEISKLNDEINIKNKNLKILSNVNKRLKISLNNLTQKLDELIYKFTKDQKKLKLKNNIMNDKEKDLEEQLVIKEKELKSQQNMINILSKDNKKLRHSLELNNFELNRSLSDKLFLKEQEIINLNKIIKDYEHKYLKHNECQKEIDILREKYLNNQKELLEKKKEIIINRKNITYLKSRFVNTQNAIDLINKNIKERNTKKKSKLNINILNSSPNSPKIINTSCNNFSPIKMKRELSENGKNNAQTIDINNKNKYEVIYNIFSEEEIDIIKKLYQNNCNKFQEFIKKIEILEKYQNSKDKAYLITLKKLKMKINYFTDKEIITENTIKDKDNKIFFLTRQIKELIKKKKVLNENNKKLLLLLDKANKSYEEEKKAKKELAHLLLKYQNENKKETDIHENNSIKEKKNITNNNNKNDKEVTTKNDNNIIVYKELLNPIVTENDVESKKKKIFEESNFFIINKDLKYSEKDLELESIFSDNIIETTPHKKKFAQYQINSNINHIEIKGVKTKNNNEILFETQPIENKKKNSFKIKNGNNIIVNKKSTIIPYKKSESLDVKQINYENKKNEDLIKNRRRMSVFNRDKSESVIINLLNSDKKGKKIKNFFI